MIAIGAVAGACFLVYRNASAIGNTISKVFQGIANVVTNAATAIYAFLNRFAEFKIIFGVINLVRDGLNLLGKTVLWLANSVVKPACSMIFGIFRQVAGIAVSFATAVGSATISALGDAVGIVSSVFRGLASIVVSITDKMVSVIGSVFSGIASVIVRVLSPVLNIISLLEKVFRGILRFISPIGTALKTVTGWTVSFARSFFIVESAIRGAARLFSTMAGTVISTIFSIARSVPSVISSIVRFFIALPGQILNIFSQIPRIVGGTFSTAIGVVRNIVSEIGNVFSGIATFASNVFSGLISIFSTIFNTLGSIVSGFGNFFLGAFTNVGTAVDWLREQFGKLCSFASETVGAIVTALGRGDIGINAAAGGYFRDLANENTAPEGVVFGHHPSQEECLIVEALLGTGSVGIWLKQTIIDGTQAREGIDGSLNFAWY